jgi:hypothetical protein
MKRIYYIKMPDLTSLIEYLKIPLELDELFQKYKKNGKYIKYIYNGYEVVNIENATSEFDSFVLIDTKKQTMELSNKIKDVVEFLELDSAEFDNLKMDISYLIEKEKELFEHFKSENSFPKKLHYRQLYILGASFGIHPN